MARPLLLSRSWQSVMGSPLTLAFVVACGVAASEALGCPNCKDAVNTSDPEGLNLARGYFYSILIMLAMPCTLISSFGIYVWREMQRQKREGLQSVDRALDVFPAVGSAAVGSAAVGSAAVASYGGSSEPATPPHP